MRFLNLLFFILIYRGNLKNFFSRILEWKSFHNWLKEKGSILKDIAIISVDMLMMRIYIFDININPVRIFNNEFVKINFTHINNTLFDPGMNFFFFISAVILMNHITHTKKSFINQKNLLKITKSIWFNRWKLTESFSRQPQNKVFAFRRIYTKELNAANEKNNFFSPNVHLNNVCQLNSLLYAIFFRWGKKTFFFFHPFCVVYWVFCHYISEKKNTVRCKILLFLNDFFFFSRSLLLFAYVCDAH